MTDENISRNLKRWSMMGARAVFGVALTMLAESGKDFYVMSADLGISSGLSRFMELYPEKFINAGIAEQNMLGIAGGLAEDGTPVFVTSFSPFVTMRSCEQVRMNMGYMGLNIKAVGLGAGLVMGELGNSHYGLEDVSVMRAIPGITVESPADGVSIIKTVEKAFENDGPFYIRLTGGPGLPIVYDGDIDYSSGRIRKRIEGREVLILASGTMVYNSLKAAEMLEDKGICVSVDDVHTIKPLDPELCSEIMEYRMIVSVEENTVIGGLGGAIAELISPVRNTPPHLILGIRDLFPKAGDYQYMLTQCGLTPEAIAGSIEEFWNDMGS